MGLGMFTGVRAFDPWPYGEWGSRPSQLTIHAHPHVPELSWQKHAAKGENVVGMIRLPRFHSGIAPDKFLGCAGVKQQINWPLQLATRWPKKGLPKQVGCASFRRYAWRGGLERTSKGNRQLGALMSHHYFALMWLTERGAEVSSFFVVSSFQFPHDGRPSDGWGLCTTGDCVLRKSVFRLGVSSI